MKKIEGLITALVTPFKNTQIDFASLERLIDQQLKDGVQGFVVNGTTAESPTLTPAEVEKVFHAVKKQCDSRVPLIIGTGTNSTADTILKTQQAEALGADAALVVVPYYNKPPQRGLFQHFEAIAKCSRLPIILYNVPGRTITALEVETVAALSKNKNIIGIKEASGKKEFAEKLRASCPKDFILLSGDDATYVEFLNAGGNGVISVASHILAKEMRNWKKLADNGQWDLARKDVARLLALIDFLFIEANPIPVKYALKLQGLIDSAEMRLPLVELEKENSEKLKKLMTAVGALR